MWEIRKMSTIRICFGFADNFLIGWSERRNNIGRNAESGKVLKSHKIENKLGLSSAKLRLSYACWLGWIKLC